MATLQVSPLFLAPSEVIEYIVLLLAEHPLSIAALAQSCRFLRTLIYRTADDHLWRNLFLSMYDDPRSTNYLVKAPVEQVEWGEEYRRRVWVLAYFRKAKLLYEEGNSAESGIALEEVGTVFETLSTLAVTASPYPPIATFMEGSSMLQTKDGKETLVRAHRRLPKFAPHPLDTEEPVKNMLAYRDFVYRGIPVSFAQVLFVNMDKIDETNAKQEFFKFIAYNGLRICPQDSWSDTPIPSSDRGSVGTPPPTFPHADDTELRAKILYGAKKRIYNMLYPKQSRLYGGFQIGRAHV